MPLTTGTRLGPYEIIGAIGAGGMGEVYRARDTKLARDVALKLLPDQFAADRERLARFEREAQVLASLNHPHIAQIYGLEDSSAGRALVMELVEGQTLAERITHGPLPVVEAMTIARQVAEALDAAHEKGIIHRDLKPANVMITHGSEVKVLDFGLAAVAQGSGSQAVDVSNSPTLTMAATRAGVILGTAAYMSPEQAAGKPVDKRADIWSFGVIVWEMLTGRRLFDGETVSHTLADVLRADIDFNTLPREIPAAIRTLVRRCLDRDVRSRLRDIGEARVATQTYLANPAAAAVTAAAPDSTGVRLSRGTAVAWSVAAGALLGAAALAFVHFRERPAVAEPVRFQILPPDQTTFATSAVLSPDGRRLAFEAPGPDGRTVLWVRALDTLGARSLPGTEGAAPGPFWSPDSRFLAFGVNGFPGRLKKVDASGGPSQTLCEFSGGFREGAWNSDGVILFGAGPNGIVRVSESGGTSSPVTKVDASRQEIQHAGPTFLPDRRHFLYHRAARSGENRGIYVGSIDLTPAEQSATPLLAAESDPVYAVVPGTRDGFLLFLREGSLLAQRFDGRATLTGDAIPIAEDVGNIGSYGWFSVSDTGALAFRRRALTAKSEFVWFDRQGKRVGQVGPLADISSSGLQLSPDGKRVVISRSEGLSSGAVGFVQGTRLYSAELSRGIFSRLNPGEGTESSPALTPAGRVVFSSTLNGAVGDLYWMSTSGIEAAEPLVLKSPTVKHANHVSPDGRFLIYDDHSPTQRQDLWILPLAAPAGGGDRKSIPFLVTQADETFGQFSPDGKWVAYYSDESGRREVYVQGFAPDRTPATAVGKWTISTAGGHTPRWRSDGKELFYLAPDRKLMAVPVKSGPASFEPGLAVPLFEANPFGFFSYDVAADGRFLMQMAAEGTAAASTPVTIVLNWQAGLKK